MGGVVAAGGQDVGAGQGEDHQAADEDVAAAAGVAVMAFQRSVTGPWSPHGPVGNRDYRYSRRSAMLHQFPLLAVLVTRT